MYSYILQEPCILYMYSIHACILQDTLIMYILQEPLHSHLQNYVPTERATTGYGKLSPSIFGGILQKMFNKLFAILMSSQCNTQYVQNDLK
jgi:hypothetical protein